MKVGYQIWRERSSTFDSVRSIAADVEFWPYSLNSYVSCYFAHHIKQKEIAVF